MTSLIFSYGTGSSFFTFRDWNRVCSRMQQVGGSLMLDGGKALVSPLRARPGLGARDSKDGEQKKFTRPRMRTSVGRSSLHVFLLNSQWRLNLTVFSPPPASQLAAPRHTAILFSFSTTTGVDSAWCGRQGGGGGGLRGGASNHMIFNSSRCWHSWYLRLAASEESPVAFVDRNVTEPLTPKNKQEPHWVNNNTSIYLFISSNNFDRKGLDHRRRHDTNVFELRLFPCSDYWSSPYELI